MVFKKVFGAFKSMGDTGADMFGRVKVGIQKYSPYVWEGMKKYGPDILEMATGLGSMIPDPTIAGPSAAAGAAIRAFRNKLSSVPNEAVRDKLLSAVTPDSGAVPSPAINRHPVIGVNADGSLIRAGGGTGIVNHMSEALPAVMKHIRNTIKTREAEAKAFRRGTPHKKQKKSKK